MPIAMQRSLEVELDFPGGVLQFSFDVLLRHLHVFLHWFQNGHSSRGTNVSGVLGLSFAWECSATLRINSRSNSSGVRIAILLL